MEYMYKVFNGVKQIYNDINPATLTGAIDVIVVEGPDGKLFSTPFHVRFGKINVMNYAGKTVDIYINDELTDLRMKLGESGEAFFVTSTEFEPPHHLATSPIPDSLLECYPQFSSNELNISPRKRSDSSPAVVTACMASSQPTSRSLLDVQERNGIDNGLVETKSLTCGFRSDDELIAARLKVGSLPTGIDNHQQKRQKRRRKISKIAKEAAAKAAEEESSSSDHEFQFQMDGVAHSSAGGATRNGNPDKERTERESLSQPHTSELMKTAKTNKPGSVHGLNANGSGNTSNTTVTSDEEFATSNWQSVASGVPPPRLASQVVSDGDLSDVGERRERPPSPAKSDTEIELRHKGGDEPKWGWGELPQGVQVPVCSPQDPQVLNHTPEQTIEPSTTVPKTPEPQPSTPPRDSKRANASGGLYLDEVLAAEDPGTRQRYIGRGPRKTPQASPRDVRKGESNDHDVESGNGPSLSQSPQSGLDSDYEGEMRHMIFDYHTKKYSDFAMSLCGHADFTNDEEPARMNERFLAHIVTYDEYILNPDLLKEQNLVFRMDGKYYNWNTISPQLLSLAMFQRPLPKDVSDRLVAEHMPKKKPNANQTQPKQRGWWWSRAAQPEEAVAAVEEVEVVVAQDTNSANVTAAQNNLVQELTAPAIQVQGKNLEIEDDLLEIREETITRPYNQKSLRLTHEQLSSLGLKPGTNLAEFKVTTAYQGTSVCLCHIYLWKYSDKIVISDVDGTITKSDVLGHILPIIGRDWAQCGVANLFDKIANNGYKLVYLSARAIGQAHTTRNFLRSVKQENCCLPDGPVLLNPTSLLQALRREVVYKDPHKFKICCLNDVGHLFKNADGTSTSPFYAGFGNKTTDALAYKAVGVPLNRIFTINPRGDISQELLGNVGKTYHCLGNIADLIFPPVNEPERDIPGEFTSFSYWKEPLPTLSVDDVTKRSDSSSKKEKSSAVPKAVRR